MARSFSPFAPALPGALLGPQTRRCLAYWQAGVQAIADKDGDEQDFGMDVLGSPLPPAPASKPSLARQMQRMKTAQERLERLCPLHHLAGPAANPGALRKALAKQKNLPKALEKAPAYLRHFTPLHFAAMANHHETAQILLDAGAKPSFFSGAVTPMGLAAYCGCPDSLLAMIMSGGDPFLKLLPEHAPKDEDVWNSTLLHRVMNRPTISERELVVDVLCHFYPDLSVRTFKGATPLDFFEGDKDSPSLSAFMRHICAREETDLRSFLEAAPEAPAALPKPRTL